MAKMTNFEFHCKNLKEIKDISDFIIKIVGKPKRGTLYSRNPGRGWWMIIKEIAINHYIDVYLRIMKKQQDCKIIYIDLLSASGILELSVTDKRRFHIAGSPLLAAFKSTLGSNSGFDRIYVNDGKRIFRESLYERLIAIDKSCYDNNRGGFYPICAESEVFVDSNEFVDAVVEDLEDIEGRTHYLAVIDNEGMNVKFDTLKKLREWRKGKICGGVYGDLIIHYPNTSINRQRHNLPLINSFFGKDMKHIPKEKWMDEYIKQLKSIGIEHVEPLEVRAGDMGYYYTLLFCVRMEKNNAPWMKMIERYRDDRFRNFTGEDVKKFWKIVHGTQKTMTSFFSQK